ncbi:MAG: rhomboid family intramembrane serine protease [Anaerolineaceae bacterium]|jgi:rhomboid protease GluP
MNTDKTETGYEDPPLPPPPPRVWFLTIKPVLTYILIGVNIVFFLLQMLSEYARGIDLPFLLLGKFKEAILAGQYWRLITPVLLHGSLLHLGFNMYALFIIGARLENVYGYLRFGLLYLLGAFGGNVLSFVLSPNPSLGSSTAIFGFLAAEVVLIIQNKDFFGEKTRGLLFNLGFVLVINFAIGLSAGMRIDNYGHLGGLIAGFFFASLAGPKWKMEFDGRRYTMMDVREKGEIWMAAGLVALGFAAMAAIPFLAK